MRFHRGNDPWGRGSYKIPEYAVAGTSYTGDSSDSPCPLKRIEPELKALRAALRKAGIRTRRVFTQSGNVFMVKWWVVVRRVDFAKADALAKEWLAAHETDTRCIHDAA
jgi:hypothetical protein